jgi:KipI family sensor histidine kinase inhibitor
MADPEPGASFRLDRAGDAALLLTLGEAVDDGLNAAVHRVAAALTDRHPRLLGLGIPVPGYASLLIPFDPDASPEADVRAAVEAALEAASAETVDTPGPTIEIPVRYGAGYGPDLPDVARRTGLSEEAVVAFHASVEYRVFLLGFVPGFPYLGVLPAALELPRRATPRVKVPAGSVAIAGRQTGIYPAASPGGWHVIGRTDLVLWDPRRDPPALLGPGSRVHFVPV